MIGRLRRIGESYILGLVLCGYLLIAVGYSVVNPLFEAPDEHWHFFTVEYIKANKRLPQVEKDVDEWLGQEAAQPPLYYLLGALLTAPIETEGAREQLWQNPYAWIGNAEALANVNRFVHTAAETWPWQGYVLSAHLLRGMSILFGMGTILFVYGSGRLLWPSDRNRAYLAASLVAFLPQFGFIHGTISNDSLITFLCSATLWQLLRICLSHVTRRRLLLLGVTVGLAALSKNAGILLLLFVAGTLALLAIRNRSSKLLVEAGIYVILPVLLLAGWLWWRNWTLYGDFTASNQFVALAGGDRNFNLLQVLGESGGLWLSFIAIFGWFNVRAPDWIYVAWSGGIVLALVGLVNTAYRGLKSRPPEERFSVLRIVSSSNWLPTMLLVAWPVFVYAGLVTFMLQTEAAQGRLLFPALLPIMLAAAHGLGRARWGGTYVVVPLLALVTTVYSIFFVVAPTYSLPRAIRSLPDNATVMGQEMGQGLKLLGSQVITTLAEPGEKAEFTLYWQAESLPSEPPEFVFELFGRDLEVIGNSHSYHGRGLYPANLWPPSQIIADRFAIRISEDAKAPTLAWAQARLVDQPLTATVGRVKVIPPEWPSVSGTALAELGNGIELMTVRVSQHDASPGETIELNVTWRVTEQQSTDYTTLIHLGESGEAPLAIGDAPPLQGDYPTSAWAPDEIIEDTYRLALPEDLPAGRFPILIGMYDPRDVTRIPLLVDGARQTYDVYRVDLIDIE